MIESRRRAYLDAMGIDVWSIRTRQAESGRLLIQPGEGETLLICETPEATATRIAGDIARAFACKVVWAWPDVSDQPGGPSLEQAVEEYLFTRVVLFGAGLERRMFGGDAPAVVRSASITVTHSMDELAALGSARQEFWGQLSGKKVN